MSLSQDSRQRSGVIRDQDQMDMVGHQTPRQNVNAMSPRLIVECSEIEAPVCVGVEYVLAIITSLGDMVGDAGNDDARTPGHIL